MSVFPRDAIMQVVPMSDDDMELLMSCAQQKELKKGALLLKEGETLRLFFLVEKGYLRTWYNKDGVAINLNFTFEGEFAANIKSFRSRKPSDLNIEAGEDASVWIFDLNTIASQYPSRLDIGRFIRRVAISLLIASEEHSDLFKIYTPAERYHHIQENNPRLLQRVSLSQMASYLGVTRETLSRIRGNATRK